MKDLPKNLRTLRISRGLSMNDLAEKSGRSKTTIYRIESGDADNINLDTLRDLAQALDVSVDTLTGTSVVVKSLSPGQGYGKRLAFIRKQKELTQDDFAKALGVDASTVYRWEHEISVPNYDQMIEISRALDVSPEEIFAEVQDERDVALRQTLRDISTAFEELAVLRRQLQTKDHTLHSLEYPSATPVLRRLFGLVSGLPELAQYWLTAALSRSPSDREQYIAAFHAASPEEREILAEILPAQSEL